MAIRRIDSSGVYREVDNRTGQFLDDDEYPLSSGIGQIEHQLIHTNNGRLYDADEVTSSVVDENGVAVISEDEAKIKEYIKNAISVENFIRTFKDNSREALLKLLALQNNQHPLKKGGAGIAYRTDALIMHCKMEFTSDENIVFDAILGTMSSYPDEELYKIKPSSFAKFSKNPEDNHWYDIFKRGAKKLKERTLTFYDMGPNSEDEISIPWFDILLYHKKEKDRSAYLEFRPTDFFKVLALSSGLVHGAYGSLEVTTQLRGKYTIAMYWFLENKKRYKEYPAATPGRFSIGLDEFMYQFSIPKSYAWAMIKERVLLPAQDSINSCSECDFTFEYEELKEGKKVIGIRFNVCESYTIDSTARDIIEIEDKETSQFEEQVRTFLSLTGCSFSDEEAHLIYVNAVSSGRDAAFVMQAASILKSRMDNKAMESVESPVAYMIALIKNGTLMDVSKIEEEYQTNKNKFNDFSQRNYDFVELEKALIKS